MGAGLVGKHMAIDMSRYADFQVTSGDMDASALDGLATSYPIDVIAEYTRPARIVENGKVVVKPALSDVESMELEGVGTSESFNTDGLRSLIKTMDIPNMIEKTLRYPGHANLMRMFRETGYFSEAPLQSNGVSIKPVNLTTALIFPHWKLNPTEVEFTIMKINITGENKS